MAILTYGNNPEYSYGNLDYADGSENGGGLRYGYLTLRVVRLLFR